MKILLALIMLVLIGCAEQPAELADLQVTACESADAGNSCDTKLPELNIVTPEECCKALGKCC